MSEWFQGVQCLGGSIYIAQTVDNFEPMAKLQVKTMIS